MTASVPILKKLQTEVDTKELTKKQYDLMIADEIRALKLRVSELEHTLLQMNNDNSPSS